MREHYTPILGGVFDSPAWDLTRNSRAPIRLVLMPLISVCRPSIGLGLLKGALQRAGMDSSVVYANMLYAESFFELYRMLETCGYYRVTDWIFAPTVFPNYEPATDKYLNTLFVHLAKLYKKDPENQEIHHALANALRAARRGSQSFIDNLADALLAGNPEIIGCSSVFEQHVASLGLLKAVRARNPSVVTVLGGANCQGRMGVATAREFSWVDYVFTGEAEDIIPEFCKYAAQYGRAIPTKLLPPGVITGTMALHLEKTPDAELPRHTLQQLDDAPVPDYSEYFEMLPKCSTLKPRVVPALLAESSRGCWWRVKKRCTFCGLNGSCSDFRVKSPERFLDELEQLTNRYSINRVEMTDNILDMRYFKTVFPELTRRKKQYSIFYETKANLTRSQVLQLHSAGVTWIQPGVEALHDKLLTLMHKGTTATQNIQTLKYACEVGMRASWSLLEAFPEECDEWHLETARWLPLIFHLQPPFQVLTVQFQRFSVYHDFMEKYGLNLNASFPYRMSYPFPEKTLMELAYYFEPDGVSDAQRSATPGIKALRLRLSEWKRARTGTTPVVLCLAKNDTGGVDIFDTRPCAPERWVQLTGPLADVYLACEPSVREDRLMERMQAMRLPEHDKDTLSRTVHDLVQRKLLLSLNGRLLALAVPGDIPSMPGIDAFPGGFTYGANFEKVVEAGGMKGL